MQVAEETASDTLDSAVTLTAPTQSLDGDRPPHTPYASVTGVGGTRLPQSRVCPEASVAHVTESLPGLLSAIGLGGRRQQGLPESRRSQPGPGPLFMEPVHPQGSVARNPKKWPSGTCGPGTSAFRELLPTHTNL